MSRRSVGLAVLSGILLALSFPVTEQHFLAWIAFVPLFIALREQAVRSGAVLAGITGLTFFCSTLYWISHALSAHGPFPIAAATLIMLLLCALLASYFATFGAMIVLLLRRRPGLLPAAAPALWVGLELARTHLLTGFPWLLLGYSQYRVLPLIQISDITGVYGVSFLIMLVNTAVAVLLEERRRVLPLAAAAVAMTAAAAYGAHALGRTDGSGGLRVSVVQGNIEQDRKWDPRYQSAVIAVYKRLTTEALKETPDLIVWPETSLPFYFGNSDAVSRERTDDLTGFVSSSGVYFIVGSALRDDGDGGRTLRNSAVFFEGGAVENYYVKHRLVPFGEYVPLKDSLFFFMDKLVQPAGDFVPGRDFTVAGIRSQADSRNVAVSAVICYEIIFPGLVRRFVDEGASVIATITNDAWFGRTSAPYQHFSMAVFRAVENRVPVARSANTGVSGFIDAKGRILDTTDIFTEGVRTRTLIPGAQKTFYTRFGDVFAWLCVIAALCTLVPSRRQQQ